VKIEVPQTLRGEGVILRPLLGEDADDYAAAFVQDPDLGRLLGIEEDPDGQAVRGTVERQSDHAGEDKAVELAIADPVSREFWGALLLHQVNWHHRRCEVGFWLIPEQRGRGIATRAVSLAVSWVFADLEMVRMEMNTTPENPAVPALARRLGFAQEGIQRSRNLERGRRVDIIWFGLLREEWTGN
jgi:[ribosomal protein S5]-alanine N-acetyltransferase